MEEEFYSILQNILKFVLTTNSVSFERFYCSVFIVHLNNIIGRHEQKLVP